MTEPKQWAIEQHIKKNPKCEWLCTHTKLENLGEQPEDRPITEPTIDTLYQKITDICFENGGATKPMVDKLYKLISDQVAKARIDELEHIVSGSEYSDDDFDWYEITRDEYTGKKYYSEVRHLSKKDRIKELNGVKNK